MAKGRVEVTVSAWDPLREVGATTLTVEYAVVFGKDLFDVEWSQLGIRKGW